MFRPKTAFENLMLSAEKRKALSKLYRMLSVNVKTGELAKSQWERDLSISWSEDEWVNLTKSNLSCSQNIAI